MHEAFPVRPAQRDTSIDFLKSLAIFGVIVIHVCIYETPIGSLDWLSNLFWGSLVRASVPLFLLCSGALLLNPNRPFSTKRFLRKNFLRIVVAMLIWALIYKIVALASAGGLSVPNLIQACKEILLFKQEYHLYYLQIMLIVYLFLPVTRILTGHSSKRYLHYFLLLWFLFGILYPTVKAFWPFTLLPGIPRQYGINMTYAAIGYGILGYYIKQFPLRRRSWYGISAVCGLLWIFFGTWLFSAQAGRLYTGFLEGMSVGVCLLAAGLFGLCVTGKPLGTKLASIAALLSKASFCMFLSHVLFLQLWKNLGLSVRLLPSILSVPLLSCLTLACGLLLYAVLSPIPVLKKWLI